MDLLYMRLTDFLRFSDDNSKASHHMLSVHGIYIYIAPLYTELQQHMLILPRTYLNGEVLQLFVGSQKLRFTEVYFESYLSTEVY